MGPSRLAAEIIRRLIRVYQWVFVGRPRRCRFEPTCSEYMREALRLKGVGAGLAMGTWRILKCHPWHPGGYDPVEPNDLYVRSPLWKTKKT